jgi:hypothetical protein
MFIASDSKQFVQRRQERNVRVAPNGARPAHTNFWFLTKMHCDLHEN